MPLSPEEIAVQAPDLAAFGLELAKSFGPDSDGGKKLSKKEIGALAKRGIRLLTGLLVDLFD